MALNEQSALVSVVPDKLKSKYDRTFTIKGEGHTIGHALSSVIRTQKGVKFCGYAIPHPTNNFFELKVTMESDSGTTSKEALIKGLSNLRDFAVHMKNTFKEAIANHETPMDAER